MYKLSDIKSKRFLVVGDLILDHYRYLAPSRLSPEAPVIIFKPVSDEWRLGGAANVAHNLRDLGANAHLCTVVGADRPADIREPWMYNHWRYGPPPITDKDRKTTVKERLVGTKFQQIARIDIQQGAPISSGAAAEMLENIRISLMPTEWNPDVIILSDYDHGVMTHEVVRAILEMAKGKPVLVDSKAMDTLSKYKGCTIFKANDVEARRMSKLDEEFEDQHIARFIHRALRCEGVAVTLGPKGIAFSSKEGVHTYPAVTPHGKDEVVDVTGAGDTVMAAIAAGLAIGMPYDLAIKLANVAAGVVVHKNGVATASVDEIVAVLETQPPLDIGR